MAQLLSQAQFFQNKVLCCPPYGSVHYAALRMCTGVFHSIKISHKKHQFLTVMHLELEQCLFKDENL